MILKETIQYYKPKHEIKLASGFIDDIINGLKTFELRKDDRDYQSGDIVLMRELSVIGGYSGREVLVRITYILRGFEAYKFGCSKEYCVWSFEVIGNKPVAFPTKEVPGVRYTGETKLGAMFFNEKGQLQDVIQFNVPSQQSPTKDAEGEDWTHNMSCALCGYFCKNYQHHNNWFAATTTPPRAKEGVSAIDLPELSKYLINEINAWQEKRDRWDEVDTQYVWYDVVVKELRKIADKYIQIETTAALSLSTPTGEGKDGWVKVEDGLPEGRNKFGDSIDCLVYDEVLFATATAWYNHKELCWKLLHFSTHSNAINVTHWIPLPSKPKN